MRSARGTRSCIVGLSVVASAARAPECEAQCLEDRLQAPVPAAQAGFGQSLSYEDDVLLIGEDAGNAAGAQSGAVYAYRRDAASGRWSVEQVLVAGDPQPGSDFGRAVKIHGDYVFVGARFQSVVTTTTGAAYVFRRDAATSSWQQIQRLSNPSGHTFDHFGISLAAHGEALLVAAPQTDLNGTNSGSVFAYRRNSVTGAFDFEQEFTPTDGGPAARFGVRVDVRDDVAVCGALLDGQAGFHAGSVYVFRRHAPTARWVQHQKLLPSDLGTGDRFGTSVAIADGVIAASSILDDDGGLDAGAVYLYRLDPATGLWAEWQKLVAPDADPGDGYGVTLRLRRGLLLVGATQDDDNGRDSGAAYLYREDPATLRWRLDRKLTASDGASGDNYGRGVAIGDGMVAVGSVLNDVGALDTGAAYVHLLEFTDDNANGLPDACESVGDSYCGPAVPNSTTSPAALTALGTPSAAARRLTLFATDLPPARYVIFLSGMQQAFLPGHAGSHGNLCIAPPLAVFAGDVGRADASGTASLAVDPGALPATPPIAVHPGETWNFQAWYRDAGTSNFTNGVTIAFE